MEWVGNAEEILTVTPQAPQFWGSAFRSTHLSPQVEVLGASVHLELAETVMVVLTVTVVTYSKCQCCDGIDV